jgi:hypothetical protein
VKSEKIKGKINMNIKEIINSGANLLKQNNIQDSNIKARFTNDKLSFVQGEMEVAYISGNSLFITRSEITDYIKIGNSGQGYFTFDVTENGLEVKWSNGS